MFKLILNFFSKISPKEIVKLIIVFELSIALFFASVVINNNDSVPGRGFEAAKVNVIQVSSTIIIFTTFVFLAFALFNYSSNAKDLTTGFKKLLKSWKSLIFMGLLSLSLIISTEISPLKEIATQGNFFRFQGLSTYLPMLLACYILYKCINRKTYHIIAGSIILSGIFQAFMAFSQIFSLSKTDPSKLTEGIWVNGYYGQANFFSGHLLLAIILASYYLSTKSLRFIKDAKQKLAVIFLSIVVLSILITAMILSYSEWGWVSLALSGLIIFSYELMTRKFFRTFVTVLPLLVFTNLVTSLIIGAYYFSKKSFGWIKEKRHHLGIVFLTTFSIALLTVLIVASFFISGWISLVVAILIIIGYELLPTKVFRIIITAVTIVLPFIVISTFTTYELRVEIWQRIRDIFQYNLSAGEYRYVFFGYGFDTLAEVFKRFGYFPTLVIDRAHNIIFDILIQTGVSGLIFFTIVVGRLWIFFRKITNNRLLFFVSAAFIIFIFKSLVNEYSITNFFQWLVLGACALKILTIDEDDDIHESQNPNNEIQSTKI